MLTKKMLNEVNQIHIFMSSFGSGTAINYDSVSTSKKVTVPTVPAPVPQRCLQQQPDWHCTGKLLLQNTTPQLCSAVALRVVDDCIQ